MISISQRLVGVMMAGIVSWGFLPAQQPGGTPEPRRIDTSASGRLNESAAAMVPITALKDGLRDSGYVRARIMCSTSEWPTTIPLGTRSLPLNSRNWG